MRQDIENIRLAANKICASHAFTSMFLWQEAMQLSIWLEPDGYLVRQESRGENHYFFPCGTDDAKARMLSMLPPDAVLHYADGRDLAFVEQWRSGGYTAEPARGDWEYLYDRQSQLELPGIKYKKVRQSKNHVVSLPGWNARSIDAQSMPLLKSLEKQWESSNYDRIGEADNAAAHAALENFDALGLVGVTTFIEQTPVGYFWGGMLDSQTFFGIVQRVVDPLYIPGLRWEMFKLLSTQVRTINLEEDMNLEGLRHNKMLLRPDDFYEMWDITLAKKGEGSI
ncbi:MAG: phosphatidylglycerol lysyltransferase domain-containing protein [Angelakisella sp.]